MEIVTDKLGFKHVIEMFDYNTQTLSKGTVFYHSYQNTVFVSQGYRKAVYGHEVSVPWEKGSCREGSNYQFPIPNQYIFIVIATNDPQYPQLTKIQE